jgi:cell division protein YceG involved in septum cleavage
MVKKQKNNAEWFTSMVEEIEAIMVESRFNSEETIIRGKHSIGETIVKNKEQSSPKILCSLVAGELGVSVRTIQQAVQFYNADPTLETLKQGKNISWRKILKTLQEPKEKKAKDIVPEHMWLGKPLSECKKKELIEAINFMIIQLENSSKKLISAEYYELDKIHL